MIPGLAVFEAVIPMSVLAAYESELRALTASRRWRVIAVDMRERGALLADEELEQLVEWLSRVWGTNQDK